MTPKLRLSILTLFPVIAVVAACDSQGSPSPTSPSRTGGSRTAVIAGRVTGISTRAATAGEFSTMATTRLTVTIVGTKISTDIDVNGQFTLTGVPPGNVQLRFTGSGVDATIVLSGIAAGDRVTINPSRLSGVADRHRRQPSLSVEIHALPERTPCSIQTREGARSRGRLLR